GYARRATRSFSLAPESDAGRGESFPAGQPVRILRAALPSLLRIVLLGPGGSLLPLEGDLGCVPEPAQGCGGFAARTGCSLSAVDHGERGVVFSGPPGREREGSSRGSQLLRHPRGEVSGILLRDAGEGAAGPARG